MNSSPSEIKLVEYERRTFGNDVISESVGTELYRRYGKQVDVQFPSPRTDHKWELTSRGWVGYIPLSEDLAVRLEPKVTDLENLFRMLEYAYKVDLKILHGRVECQTLEEFYERLTMVLARRVLDRSRRGLYRTYEGEERCLPYIRGRWRIRESFRRPWVPNPLCEYEDHTADNDDNQILSWTLFVVIRSGLCTERVLPTLRKAFRLLQNRTTLSAKSPGECVGRLYNRLNIDYHPMHALCRFFLEHCGPTHREGDRTALPFLVSMARLFELFVAEWLIQNIPEGLTVKVQEKVDIDETRGIQFAVDLVLLDPQTRVPRCILDTKYKVTEQPDAQDIEQVVAYAEAMHCAEAILVYPVWLSYPLDKRIGRIRVRSLSFTLDGDLETTGGRFLEELMAKPPPPEDPNTPRT